MRADFKTTLAEMNRTSLGRRAFLSMVPALLATCSSRHKLFESDALADFTVDDEKFMAREALLELRRDYPALQDAEVQNYLAELGARLTKTSDLDGKPYSYTFTVVDTPMINAFALPGGTVFISLPLLRMTESEAELAGVLGHEIGHICSRHAALRIMDQRRAKKESWWYGTGGSAIGAAVGWGATSIICPETQYCASQLVAMGVAAGVQGGLLVQKYRFLANSRENEMQADRIAFAVATRAGYVADQAGVFYTRMQNMEKTKKKEKLFLDVINTHPPSDERVAQWQELSSTAALNTNHITSTPRFEKIKKRAETIHQD